ncbi:hypothetical protein GUITHDRAFT_161198 [Guillardia theta CCMP2712]|uniref:Coenzyme Q-binding protein COQ10 START domain-containing protein n=1 Tax=Guillardia theta (strain CCMP2712) TaxID=905079 RepID=L1JVW4_GUITC|nr:hypothetical protein GUITHDRAFT_161198 [Guillardia theta CCMP2712]EKX52464.1 hypothetical protein GUITHDRAFT_161198 [Guillardia theta CCMP2712]|eukprot:XP_005839444.1 hypothetical protein GUITHDRAFT_161198 [Guillardia theta CCMP2712]
MARQYFALFALALLCVQVGCCDSERLASRLMTAQTLRLRGGGWLDSVFQCFGSCFTHQHGEENHDGKRTKSRIGRMERTITINAPIKKIYKVITDFKHYNDWSGDGIKDMVIKQSSPTFWEIQYITGCFGLKFYFSMYWAMNAPSRVAFRNVHSTRLIKMLRGEYTLKEISSNSTQVFFTVSADISGPIPHFVKVAIAKLLVHIACMDLKTYVESERSDVNLKAYGLWPEDAGVGATIQHITRFISQMDTNVKPLREMIVSTATSHVRRIKRHSKLYLNSILRIAALGWIASNSLKVIQSARKSAT